jgi:hypothetical protein
MYSWIVRRIVGFPRGKRQIAGWMARFASLRPQFTVCDAAAAGPPWNLRILMRFEDRIDAQLGPPGSEPGGSSSVIV